MGVVSVLAELCHELASSINLETSQLINKVETNAGRLLELKGLKDKDGDGVMVNKHGEGDLGPSTRLLAVINQHHQDGGWTPHT